MAIPETPRVTISMSVYNPGPVLREAIRSILEQTYNNLEFIIINDGSTDCTLDILSEFKDARIKIVNDGKNKGLATRLNQSISMATGYYFARMDADDISYSDRIEKQVAFLRNNPDVSIVGGAVCEFNDAGATHGKHVSPTDNIEIMAKPWCGVPLAHPTWCGKTEWFAKNKYKSNSVMSEDQELLIRASGHSRYANIDSIVLGYRVSNHYLRKDIKTKLSFVRDAGAIFVEKREYYLLGKLLFCQYSKLLILSLSYLFGFKMFVKNKRLIKLTSAELDEWKKTYFRINEYEK